MFRELLAIRKSKQIELKMTINRKIIFGGVYLLIGFCIETSVGQVTCKPYTLVQLPGAMPTNEIATTITTKSDCESSCLNDASCFGFAFKGTGCSLNRQAVDALLYNATSVDYYNLIRNYTNCNSASNCTYSWSGVKDQHGSGATNANIGNLNDCIKLCQDGSLCVALDWNAQDKSCWTYNTSQPQLYRATYIYFFSKTCTLPSTTLPTTPPLSSTTTSTSTMLPSSTTTTTTKPASSSSSSSPMSGTPTNQTTVSTTTPTTVPSTTPSATTASLCNGVKCGMGEMCGMNKTCVCSTDVCNKIYSPVCGSDNRTYSNECELYKASCMANKTIRLVRSGRCEDLGPGNELGNDGSDGEFASNPISIRPAYIVLAGIGGGCLLLVLTAVIILCEYPLRGAETYSSSGTLVNGRNGYASQDIKMEPVDGGEGGEGGGEGGGGGEENVEFNPYYNRSEMGAPDFTKEENIM